MKDFMEKRLTRDFGEIFGRGRYGLASKNGAIISPYGSYELFYEMTFEVIPKLGAYEDIGTPEECRKAVGGWILPEDKLPEVDEYVLLSFENYSGVGIGRLGGDEEEGFNWFIGDNDVPLIKHGLFVNAWRPLPRRYDG